MLARNVLPAERILPGSRDVTPSPQRRGSSRPGPKLANTSAVPAKRADKESPSSGTRKPSLMTNEADKLGLSPRSKVLSRCASNGRGFCSA